MTDLTEDLGTTLWVVHTVFAVIATATVLGRFAARKVRRMSFGADDWLICIALLLNWAMYALAARAQIHGMGKHISTLKPWQISTFTKNLYFMQIAYIPAPPAIKLSLLCLYRRIFKYTQSRFLWLIYAMMAIITTWCTINLFLVISFCVPISALWTGKGKCLDLDPYSYAVINIVTTLVVWAMPIPRVWRLNLPRGQKVAVSLVFMLGLFDCSTAIGRVIIMPDENERDKTWYYAKPCMMHIIEVSTGIVCTCLPVMRVSIKEAFGGRCCFCFGGGTGKKGTPDDNGRYRGQQDGHSTAKKKIRGEASGDVDADADEDFWRLGPVGGCRTEITRCSSLGHTNRWPGDERRSRQILVTEEVDVELRAVERVVQRDLGKAGDC